jgi:hypothetical protein
VNLTADEVKLLVKTQRVTRALRDILLEVQRLEGLMNQPGNERPPTGDDYNELVNTIYHVTSFLAEEV